MTLLLQAARENRGRRPLTHTQRIVVRAGALRELTMGKRDRWTEADVIALPSGEHDYFERKGGGFLGQGGFREDLSKALSALSNSGGGHLLIGVADGGALEGVEPMHGRTSTREWLEQIASPSLSPPLADYRVHQVEPTPVDSQIASGRVVIVIDVADSVVAPHQAQPQNVYFYRAGGRSQPAPHFFLEALRNDGHYFVEGNVIFEITNEGNVAAYKWTVVLDVPLGRELKFRPAEFPRAPLGNGGILLDETILPGLSRMNADQYIGFSIERHSTVENMVRGLENLFRPDLGVTFRIASEVSRGQPQRVVLRDAIDLETLAQEIFAKRPSDQG